MTEDQLTEVLQANLAQYRIKVVVRHRQDHLHVLLTRPPGPFPNYQGLANQIRGRLMGLSPTGVSAVTLYGREAGSQDSNKYEWQETYPFDPTEKERLMETVSMDEMSMDAARVQTFLDDNELMLPETFAEEEVPTELYGPGGAPPPRVPASPGEYYSKATVQEQIPGQKPGSPLPKSLVALLVAVGGAVVVVAIVLLSNR